MDRRFSTEQEVKLFHTARATREHRFGGVSTTSRGRDFFSTCDILWLRAMFMVRDILGLDLAVNWVSKALNRVKKIPNLVAVNSATRGFHCSHE